MNSKYEQLADEMNRYRLLQASAVYKIGLTVIAAKENLTHGTFLRFLQDPRVGLAPRKAQLYIAIARSEDGEQIAQFGVGKAIQLLRLKNPQVRQAFAANRPVNNLTVRELRLLIDQEVGKTARRSKRHSRSAEQEDQNYRNGRTEGYSEGKAEGYKDGRAEGYRRGYTDATLGVHSKETWARGVLHLRNSVFTENELKRAYWRMAKALHTDRGVDDRTLIQTANEAKAILDRFLKNMSRVA